MATLRRKMTVEDFESHYHYAAELKQFARQLGIHVGDLRKIELEAAIKSCLKTGVVPDTRALTKTKRSGVRDALTLATRVIDYVDDKTTKQFLLNEVAMLDPSLKLKSGQWYWLNDWRRNQLRKGARITYRDVVRELRRLMSQPDRLPQIPSARFNNFITDFLADPANRANNKSDAVAAWEQIKRVPGPKTYAAFRKLRATRNP